MTLTSVQNFQVLSALSTPRAQASETSAKFVPWATFGAISTDANGGNIKIAVSLSPEESRQQKLLQELEQKKTSVLKEIQQKENEINVKIEELNAREDAVLQKEKDVMLQLEFLQNFSKDFSEIKKGYWAENANEIVDFSLNLVEKLVMERIVDDPSILIQHIKTVLEEMKIDEPIQIHFSADDLDSLQRSTMVEIKTLIEDPKIKWLGDLRLQHGEINIDTSQYRLDASILSAIGNLRDDFKIKNLAQHGVDEQNINNNFASSSTVNDSNSETVGTETEVVGSPLEEENK